MTKEVIQEHYENEETHGDLSDSKTHSRQRHQYRLLALQPLAICMDHLSTVNLDIQGISCQIALRPVHEDAAVQRVEGGTYVILHFQQDTTTDLMMAANIGLGLIEDFLSAISIIEGATFQAVKPIQITRCNEQENRTKFAFFPSLSISDWSGSISENAVSQVRKLLAHWDGLDNGKRLRRAARQYRRAIGNCDDLLAFEGAYAGLEALEKPLALSMGIKAGCEEVQGKCESCGAEYTRRRTVLAGVRAYVHSDFHSGTAIKSREQEWKKINELRNNLVHSLDDLDKLERSARELLPVVMHYLHDAVCCLSHAHDLESGKYKIIRHSYQPVLKGSFIAEDLGPIEHWGPLVKVSEVTWVKHEKYGLVPEYSITNKGLKELEMAVYWLTKSLGNSTERELSDQVPLFL